jgi:uncharacterized protein (DUF2062 family)
MEFWNKRIVEPIKALLLQGVSADKLAWSLTAGIVVGVFPALGTTTVLCAAASWLFRLNPVAIQLVNWLAYPLQVLLLIPFWQWGDRLFGYPPIELTVEGLQALISLDWRSAVDKLWWTSFRGIVVWALIAVPTAVFLQRLLRKLLRGLLQNSGKGR